MLTTTYKLVAKLIVVCLRAVLLRLVSERQTGFVPFQQILENISITTLAFDYVKLHKIQCLFLKLDFKKAFDQVGFKYIWETLEAIGLGGKFLMMVKGLILGGSVKIHVNGLFSEDIKL